MFAYIFGVLIVFAGCMVRFFRAEKYLYGNEDLFVHTPEHDVENVKRKHRKIWLCLFVFNFFPIVLIVIEILMYFFASESLYETYDVAKMVNLIWIFIVVWAMPSNKHGFLTRDLEKTKKTVGRYMVYSNPGILAAQMGTLLFTIVAIVCLAMLALHGVKVSQLDKNVLGVLFIEMFALSGFANYAIIRAFYNTPRELVLNEVAESDYDKAAKRYYGIWRNRLILANAAAGAQLVLGGFATLTNAGVHLAGVRYLGIVVLVIVFSYILIQSRDFDAPIIVKGMVYPSEKKRITLNRIVLASVMVYIIGAIILL